MRVGAVDEDLDETAQPPAFEDRKPVSKVPVFMQKLTTLLFPRKKQNQNGYHSTGPNLKGEYCGSFNLRVGSKKEREQEERDKESESTREQESKRVRVREYDSQSAIEQESWREREQESKRTGMQE